MDWVHCNICFTFPSNHGKFHLTSCGHIFCDKCISKNPDKVCRICGQNYNGLIQLTNQMKPDVQIYFMDIKDLHRNILKQIQQVQLVAEFQKGHLQRLGTYQKQKLSKFSEMMSQAKELERKYRETLHENERLKHFIKSKGFHLSEIVKSSIPPEHTMILKTPNSNMKPHSNQSRTPRNTPMRNLNHSMNSSIPPSPLSNLNFRSHNPSPTGSISRSSQRTPIAASPRQSSSMVAPGRITMRTPPVNGKIGPIVSSSSSFRNQQLRSPINMTPRQMSSQSRFAQPYYKGSASKIGQVLSGSSPQVLKNYHSTINTPRDEKKPIQLNPKDLSFPSTLTQS